MLQLSELHPPEQIIDDLYSYRDPITGRRLVALALKNRDAAILGMDGDRCGDIVYFMAEGFNIIHADSLSTQKGYFDTSVSPIFVAAGKGIKEGYTVTRHIRQVACCCRQRTGKGLANCRVLGQA